jgi:hypothetical protein
MGCPDGIVVGWLDGFVLGKAKGCELGCPEGTDEVGSELGCPLGTLVLGSADGCPEGTDEGIGNGSPVGIFEIGVVLKSAGAEFDEKY